MKALREPKKMSVTTHTIIKYFYYLLSIQYKQSLLSLVFQYKNVISDVLRGLTMILLQCW